MRVRRFTAAAVATMALFGGAVVAQTAAAAPAAAGSCSFYGGTKLVSVGMVGEAVKEVQCRINVNTGANLSIDGKFGEQTRQAVVAFQRSRGLAADGIVGPNTWRALRR